MSNAPFEGRLERFVGDAEEAADAYVRGDMERYLNLVHHAEEFTLLPPYGGPAGRHRQRDETVRAATDFIRDGAAHLEHVETHAWGDTVVVAMIERQHGRLEGRPDQDLSLRVTHVYRREGDQWKLVHRHADPLVNTMSLDDLAAMMGRRSSMTDDDGSADSWRNDHLNRYLSQINLCCIPYMPGTA